MTRLPDWRGRLGAYRAAARARPFCYGTHDCATFAAGAVGAVSGIDPIAALGIRYTSLAGGHRALRALGYPDHVAVVRERFAAIPMAFARLGDLAVIETKGGPALAVVGGAEILAVAPERGLVAIPLDRGTMTYRV